VHVFLVFNPTDTEFEFHISVALCLEERLSKLNARGREGMRWMRGLSSTAHITEHTGMCGRSVRATSDSSRVLRAGELRLNQSDSSRPRPSLRNGTREKRSEAETQPRRAHAPFARTLLLLPVVRRAVRGRDAASRRGDSTNDSFRTTPDGLLETALLLFAMKKP
jgi:hypothetical protein